MTEQKKLLINLSSSLLAFIVNIGISFFLTPYIVRSLGIEAYGFVQLGTNFINYASLLTIALNSMAGRFITIEIHRNNWEGANKYFTSVLIANTIIAMILSVPAILCVFYIDKIINVPVNILNDVRMLFLFLFLNFLFSMVASVFSVSTFATNRLYLQSLREIESNIIRSLLLIILFVFFNPKVSYIGIVAFIVVFYKSVFNFYYTKIFLPKVNIKKIYFKIESIIELITSGIWNSLIHLGNILLQGLNLLIANLFISASAMGTLALANTIPTVFSALIGTVTQVFMPNYTILYAKRKTDELIMSINSSMKILGLITNIPIALLIAFGEEFFKLWVPGENAQILQWLSVLSISVFIVSGSINCLYNIFTVTNKLKMNAFVLIFTGILNVPIVLILLNITNLDVFAIVLVSSILGILRNLFFTIPYSAKYLGLKWYTFYPQVMINIFAFIAILIIGFLFHLIWDINSWTSLVLISIVTATIGLLINLLLLFRWSELSRFFILIKQKLYKVK